MREGIEMCEQPQSSWIGTADGIRCGLCGAPIEASAPEPVKVEEPKPEPVKDPEPEEKKVEPKKAPVKKPAPKKGGKK